MILLLGGTAEARALAAELVRAGIPVISSLAGRVARPALPEGPVRIGGFGGISGLVDYLRAVEVTAIVDATHPFAATMSEHAATAAALTDLPILRLHRPGWSDHPDADEWTWVPDMAAARLAAEATRHPFVTTGRQSLATFLPWAERGVIARLVERPDFEIPMPWTVILSRGPYTVDGERQIMTERRVDVLITKDSGGRLTEAKLTAAAQLGLPVVIVARPPAPTADSVTDVSAALAWLGVGESA